MDTNKEKAPQVSRQLTGKYKLNMDRIKLIKAYVELSNMGSRNCYVRNWIREWSILLPIRF